MYDPWSIHTMRIVYYFRVLVSNRKCIFQDNKHTMRQIFDDILELSIILFNICLRCCICCGRDKSRSLSCIDFRCDDVFSFYSSSFLPYGDSFFSFFFPFLQCMLQTHFASLLLSSSFARMSSLAFFKKGHQTLYIDT